MAIDELDQGRGVSGIVVANKFRIHPAFVTNQTKKLEQLELLARVTSPDDARFLQMSLTEKARAEITKLSNRRQALTSTMFSEVDKESLDYLNKRLTSIAKIADWHLKIEHKHTVGSNQTATYPAYFLQ
ncbi:MarR family winged helix-turn-helix transcriptional regulator [Bradyrhizobium sp. RDI18]|uniref:MarR family winged helix-turn-helix transcriptional regulator n=1 Tax=Bradyrhizobium sp. RDI18 TaxID=3367400 RepID=UPI00371A4BFA